MKTLKILLIGILIVFSNYLTAQVFTNYTDTTSGLPDNFVSGGIAIDHNNVKWFGTQSGVARFDDTSWTVYTTANGLLNNYISCIGVDKYNNIWAGSTDGVNKFDGTTWISYTTSDGLTDNSIVYICGDNNGNVWVGTYSGLSKYDGTNWTTYNSGNGLPSDLISYINADTAGNKWFGTILGGVVKYNDVAFEIIDTTSDHILDNNISSVTFDSNEKIWIGTYYGISVVDDSFTVNYSYEIDAETYKNYVQDIAIAGNGYTYVGVFADYLGQGSLLVFDGTSWQNFTETDGLVNKMVKRIATDNNGNAWITTGGGVSMLDMQSSTLTPNSYPVVKTISKTGVQTIEYNNIAIFPNPAGDVIHIADSQNSIIEIFDITGQSVLTQNIIMEDEVNISNLLPGLYIVQITNNQGQYNSKLLKQ